MSLTTTPRVSVIIPTYNRVADVSRAIASALAQTLPPYQVIVVDDGSTDATRAVVGAMPAPVQYVHKPNGGVSSARNLAFEHVQGDYVAMLDSDDYWDPGWLAEAVASIGNTPGAGAAVCVVMHCVTPDGAYHGAHHVKARPVDGVITLQSLLGGSAMGSNLVLRTEVQRRVGDFDASLVTGEDVDYALRVAAATVVASVARPSVFVTISVESLSKRINTGNRLKVYAKFERLFPQLAREHADSIRAARVKTTIGYARDLMWHRQLDEARVRLRESWSYRPSLEAAMLMGKLALLRWAGRGKPGATTGA